MLASTALEPLTRKASTFNPSRSQLTTHDRRNASFSWEPEFAAEPSAGGSRASRLAEGVSGSMAPMV